MCEMAGQFIQKKQEEKQIKEDQAANARYLKILACYDDNDNYNFTITPNELSSVENLVPNPSESKGENGCDVPACFTTFSNILFDADYDFYSSGDQSLYDEDVPEKIFSNPLFEAEIIPMKIDQHHDNAESDLVESLRTHDSSIISSSKIDFLFDEFAGELTLLKSILPGIDETVCDPEEDIHLIERLLYDNSSPRPPKEFVYDNSDTEIESFSPSPIPIEDDDYDSERDILILKDLLSNDTLSLLVIESYQFDIPSFSRPPAKLPDEKSPDLLSHRILKAFQLSAKCLMMIHGKNIPILDVPLFHFTPLINSSMGKVGQAQRPKTSASWEAPHAYP
nr:hypothetical protein [Tanacetum cinerariifolium]